MAACLATNRPESDWARPAAYPRELADWHASLQESRFRLVGSQEFTGWQQDCAPDVLFERRRSLCVAWLLQDNTKDATGRHGIGAQAHERSYDMTKSKHRGPTLDSFLEGEGIRQELQVIVAKERIAFQLSQAMKKKRITKVKLAELMDTSRTQIDRILDPASGNVTIETLQRVARIVGRELRVELV
jgi:antitoxin HicB